jgi:hypothetical protein
VHCYSVYSRNDYADRRGGGNRGIQACQDHHCPHVVPQLKMHRSRSFANMLYQENGSFLQRGEDKVHVFIPVLARHDDSR